MKNNQQLKWQHEAFQAHRAEAEEIVKILKSRQAIVTATEVSEEEVVIRFTLLRTTHP
jgi:hypothetical protein